MGKLDHLIFLGGVEEMGANSVYVNMGGNGIVIDAGLHPRNRTERTFPLFGEIKDREVYAIAVTHAHTDHLGALPFFMKYYPAARVFMTRQTRDLAEIMLKDTAKLLSFELNEHHPPDTGQYYSKEFLTRLYMILEGVKFEEAVGFEDRSAVAEAQLRFYRAGHILGAASVHMSSRGKSLLHTGDISFADQMLIKGASVPRRHTDVMITEATNCAKEPERSRAETAKALAAFINETVNNNGSILMPAFSLGKTQEMLKLAYEMMWAGDIPHLPIYSAGMGRRISLVYDRYCYGEGMVEPGFEVSDIEQLDIDRQNLSRGRYFKEPSLVIVSNGMFNKGTISYNLALEWFKRKNFSIAVVGYQAEDSPGRDLLAGADKKEFHFGGRKVKRICRLGEFRFSGHAEYDEIFALIDDIRPKKLFIVHGDMDACDNLAARVHENIKQTEVVIPKLGKTYQF